MERKTKIFSSSEWFTGLNEDIRPIERSKFLKLLNGSPDPNPKNPLLYLPLITNEDFLIWNNNHASKTERVPNLIKNIKCYNFIDKKSKFNPYVLLPLKENHFGVIRNNKWLSKLNERMFENFTGNYINTNFRWAIYKDKKQWLKNNIKYELWTDEPCLVCSLEAFYKSFK